MSIFEYFRNRRVKREEEKRLKEIDAQMMKKRLLSEVNRAQLSASTLESKMDRKLRVACNKAYLAKQSGQTAVVKNAYVDIKTALYFRKVAQGLSSALDRLQSNLQYASIAENMSSTLEKASTLSSSNPQIDVAKLSLLYDKVMGPLGNIVDRLGDFGEMNADFGFDDFDVSDEEVENIIRSVSASPNGTLSSAELNRLNIPGAEFKPQDSGSWADDTADYINDMMKKYGFKS